MNTRFRTALLMRGILATGILGAVATVAPPAFAQTRYVSPGAFSLVPPAKWQFDDADKSMGRVRYVLTEPSQGRVLASLEIKKLTDKKTLDELADAVRQTAKDNGEKGTVVRDKKMSNGLVIETLNARPEEPDTEMTFLSVRNGVACKMILKCKTADAAKYAPVFNKAVSTFKWK